MGLSLRFQSSTYSSSKPNITTPNHSHWNWWLLELNKKDQWFKGKMQYWPLNTTTPKVPKPYFWQSYKNNHKRKFPSKFTSLSCFTWIPNSEPVHKSCEITTKLCLSTPTLNNNLSGTTEVLIIHLNIWWDKSVESECQTSHTYNT